MEEDKVEDHHKEEEEKQIMSQTKQLPPRSTRGLRQHIINNQMDQDEMFWNYAIYAEDSSSDEDFVSSEESSGMDSFDSDFDGTDDDELIKGRRRKRTSTKKSNRKNNNSKKKSKDNQKEEKGQTEFDQKPRDKKHTEKQDKKLKQLDNLNKEEGDHLNSGINSQNLKQLSQENHHYQDQESGPELKNSSTKHKSKITTNKTEGGIKVNCKCKTRSKKSSELTDSSSR